VAFAALLIVQLLGEAIVEAIERRQSVTIQRAHAAWYRLRQFAAAPPGLDLVARDGSGATYTGIAFLERSRAVLLIAVHHPSQSPRPRSECADWGDHVRHPSVFDEDNLVQDERNPLYRR